jgi:hypothetical protein
LHVATRNCHVMVNQKICYTSGQCYGLWLQLDPVYRQLSVQNSSEPCKPAQIRQVVNAFQISPLQVLPYYIVLTHRHTGTKYWFKLCSQCAKQYQTEALQAWGNANVFIDEVLFLWTIEKKMNVAGPSRSNNSDTQVPSTTSVLGNTLSLTYKCVSCPQLWITLFPIIGELQLVRSMEHCNIQRCTRQVVSFDRTFPVNCPPAAITLKFEDTKDEYEFEVCWQHSLQSLLSYEVKGKLAVQVTHCAFL